MRIVSPLSRGLRARPWVSTRSTSREVLGARNLPEAAAACTVEMRGEGPALVSEAFGGAWLPKRKGRGVFASLSACGMLCVGGRALSKLLTVARLPTRRAVRVTREEEAVHGLAYTNELYAALAGRAVLRLASVEGVPAGRTYLDAFDRFWRSVGWGHSPRLGTAPRRVVEWGCFAAPGSAWH
eukprot:gnl/Chilomastix_cuspidata/5841.p3 GENE.gnl/Chilomastix_cuspidata/5841~~gnl/Chilomastix_cuspidata/5841.p3  ORF type:complete len:183 (-),score=6.20 gnl/Chilomastix_cuspidata/5841:1165-1713(-)